MDKKWLQEYTASEWDEYQKFLGTFVDGKIPPGVFYPSKKRFPRLQTPYSAVAPRDLWGQLPFYGSSFVGIPPRSRDSVVEFYGLGSARDFEGLVNLAKTTGRVQFTLASMPEAYEGLDYLDPIFQEMRPPMAVALPDGYFSPAKNKKDYEVEFTTIAAVKYIPFLQENSKGVSPIQFAKRVDDYRQCYANLKMLGYTEVCDLLLNVLIDSPFDAFYAFNLFMDLIARPSTNPFYMTYNPIENFSKQDLSKQLRYTSEAGLIAPSSDMRRLVLPYDIGKFLMKKMTYLPESYDACIAVMDRYNQEDLSGLISAIQQGCSESKVDVVDAKEKELEIVFDNLWKDSKRVKSLSRGLRYAVLAELGIVGSLATASIAGIGGILASLGFEITDQAFNISRQAAKRFVPNHLVVVDDFKTKYNIQ